MPEEPAIKPVESQEKKKKERSPAYPAIGLRKAVENAEKLWNGGVKHHSVLISVAAEAMGYNPTSSVGVSAISAMKKFGLLDEEGSKEQRKVRITDLAKSILNPTTPNKIKLLQEAALKPAIHADLRSDYKGGLPPDAQIKSDLIWNRQFTEAAAVALIEEFRDTLAFAKFEDGDTLGLEEQREETSLAETSQPTQTPMAPIAATTPSPSSPRQNLFSTSQVVTQHTNLTREYRVPLDDENDVEIRFFGEEFGLPQIEALLDFVEYIKTQLIRKNGGGLEEKKS